MQFVRVRRVSQCFYPAVTHPCYPASSGPASESQRPSLALACTSTPTSTSSAGACAASAACRAARPGPAAADGGGGGRRHVCRCRQCAAAGWPGARWGCASALCCSCCRPPHKACPLSHTGHLLVRCTSAQYYLPSLCCSQPQPRVCFHAAARTARLVGESPGWCCRWRCCAGVQPVLLRSAACPPPLPALLSGAWRMC